MSFEAIQQEVASWPDEQLKKLRAYLYVLDRERAGEPVSGLAAKLQNPNQKWYSIEEAEKMLGLDQDEN